MNVEIYFPFVDCRKLSEVDNNLVVENPSWPDPSEGFLRCMGGINYYDKKKNEDSNQGHVNKGLKLTGKYISGLIGLKRTLDFPFGNDIFGVYRLSFTFQKNSFNHSSPFEIFHYFYNKILFNVKDLVTENPDLLLASLPEYLKKQYYWATRKLVKSPDNRDSKLYEIDNLGHIKIPNMETELKLIKFMDPYFVVESTSSECFDKDKIFGKYLHFGFISVSRTFRDGFNIFHFHRPWFAKNIQKIKFNLFKQSLILHTLFFNMLYHAIELSCLKGLDKSSNYTSLINKRLEYIFDKNMDTFFREWRKFYTKKYPRKNISLITKLDKILGPNNVISQSIYDMVQ